MHCVVSKGCSDDVHQAGNEGYTMQIPGRRTLLTEQTGSTKILNVLMCSGNGWRPAWLEQNGQEVGVEGNDVRYDIAEARSRPCQPF